MNTTTRGWRGAAALALGLLGCGGTPDAVGAEATAGAGGGPTTAGSGAGGSCAGAGGAGAATIDLRWPTSGMFLGGYLHVAAQRDGAAERYHVLQLAGGEGYLLRTVEALTGPARLVRVWDPALYGRLRTDAGAIQIDLVDATDPASPVLQKSRVVPGTVPGNWRSAFSAIGGHAVYCAAPTLDAEPVMMGVNFFGDEEPAPLAHQPEGEKTCAGYSQFAGTAFGTTWVTWGVDSDAVVYDVTAGSSTHLADYYYNPDGVHHYGNVVGVESDGSRIVFDPSNNSEVFLYAVGSGMNYLTHAYFGSHSPQKLLAVVGQVAYLASAKAVTAWSVADIDAPALLDFHVDADFGDGLATLVAADAKRLVVSDADGRLHVVPLDGSGPARPLVVHPGPPPVGCGG
jgi:hypothetical protein